jgi:hypothetical protein
VESLHRAKETWDEEGEEGDGKEVLGRRTVVAFVLVVKSQALALLHLL